MAKNETVDGHTLMLLVDGMLRIKPNITKLNQSLPMSIVHLEKS